MQPDHSCCCVLIDNFVCISLADFYLCEVGCFVYGVVGVLCLIWSKVVRDSEIVLFPAPTLEYWSSCSWLAVSLERFSLSQYGVHQRWCSFILHDCKSSSAVARWHKQTNICSVADRRCVESSCMFRLVGLIPDCNGFMGNPLRSKLGRESELQHLLQI